MTVVSSSSSIKTVALHARARLFQGILYLGYDSYTYLGHLVTKTAIEAGYVAKRKNLKGNTIVEWAKTDQVDGQGAPNQWACFAAADLLIQDGHLPADDDDELHCALAYHWNLAHGPFTSIDDANSLLPEKFRAAVFQSYLKRAIDEYQSDIKLQQGK